MNRRKSVIDGRGAWRRERLHRILQPRIGRSEKLRPPLSRPHHVERTVYCDAVEPGAETGPLVKLFDFSVDAQQGLLHHVLGVLFVTRHTKSEAE